MTGNLVVLGVAIGQTEPIRAHKPVVDFVAYVAGVPVAAHWLRYTPAADANPRPDRNSATVAPR